MKLLLLVTQEKQIDNKDNKTNMSDKSREIESSSKLQSLPTNIEKKEELCLLPNKFLSDDTKCPLKSKYIVNNGTENEQHIDLKYALRPLWYSVIFILCYQALEPLAYYGVSSTETEFLLGNYNQNNKTWGPHFEAADASTLSSITQGLSFTAPIIGGLIADGFLGDFRTILLAGTVFYLPGLVLISLSTFPGLLGTTFNSDALLTGLIALMPLGMGLNKACMNAFGAKQFHPVLQSSKLEQYFVFLYVAVNIGGLLGTIIIPVLAQIDLVAAYLIPVSSLLLGLIMFLVGSGRYIKTPPQRATITNMFEIIGQYMVCKPLDSSKISNGGHQQDAFVDGIKRLFSVVPVGLLVVPFTMAYVSTFSVTVVQGSAMKPVGLIDASVMQVFNPIFVLIFGCLVGNLLYPSLAKHDIKIKTTSKFAIGTLCGALFFGYSWLIDFFMKAAYENDESQISIMYQIPAYMFIAVGEVFAVTASYEVAFAIAPKEQKSLCSGINLFVTTGLANFICVGLNQIFASWFPSDSSSSSINDYANSQMGLYFMVLLVIQLIGIGINLIPFVRNWVERLRKDASDAETTDASSAAIDDDISERTTSSSSVHADLELQSVA